MSGWGARIEVCACGHPRSGLDRGVGHFESGFGPCKAASCACRGYAHRLGDPVRLRLGDGSVLVLGPGLADGAAGKDFLEAPVPWP